MRLILAGGGSAEQSQVVDKFFLDLFDTSKTMLYIPIAISFGEKHSEESVYNWITTTFGNLEYNSIEMVVDLEQLSYEELSHYGAIYIGGGNTFKLLKEFKETGFYNRLEQYLQNDIGPVYGGSAGAILFGKTIMTAQLGEQIDPEIEGFSDYNSYDVLNGLDIDVHYFPRHDGKVWKYVQEHNREIISIPEESALFVQRYDSLEYHAVGTKTVYHFTEGERIEVDRYNT